MWFEVKKGFGHHKVGDKIELKSDSQYPVLVEKGLIEECEAPTVEAQAPVTGTYSTAIITKEPVKGKKEVKK